MHKSFKLSGSCTQNERQTSSVAKQVQSQISRYHGGRIFTAENFKVVGSHDAILRSLSRLVEKGEIKRIHKGIYYKPEISHILKGKALPPDLNETIKVISRSNKEKLQVHGAIAANTLGISNQVPMTKVFYTSGASREIIIAGSRVKFIHTESKILLQSSSTEVGLAISAMYFLGKELVNEKVIFQIKSYLTEEQFEDLKNLKLTSWMKSALDKKEYNHYDVHA